MNDEMSRDEVSEILEAIYKENFEMPELRDRIANIPKILDKGPKWFNAVGTDQSPGYKCFSVSGHVNKPGNYEIPLGTPFEKLLEIAGGVKDGKKLKAVYQEGHLCLFYQVRL